MMMLFCCNQYCKWFAFGPYTKQIHIALEKAYIFYPHSFTENSLLAIQEAVYSNIKQLHPSIVRLSIQPKS